MFFFFKEKKTAESQNLRAFKLFKERIKALKPVSGHFHFLSHMYSTCSLTSEQFLLVGQDSAKLIEPGHFHFHRRSL